MGDNNTDSNDLSSIVNGTDPNDSGGSVNGTDINDLGSILNGTDPNFNNTGGTYNTPYGNIDNATLKAIENSCTSHGAPFPLGFQVTNETATERNSSSCITDNGSTICSTQDGSAWNQTDCLPGFYCPNNNASFVPMYCPPTAECLANRLAQQICNESQGTYEPLICQPGFYCPPEGGMIKCPAGSFCPLGSYEPHKCSVGANCAPGSVRDMTFFPLAILIILDVALVIAVVLDKIRDRYKAHQAKGAAKESRPLLGHIPLGPRHKSKKYQELNNFHSMEVIHGVHMEPNIDFRRKPTGFEQLGLMEADYVLGDQIHNDHDGSTTSDLQQFVNSLSKILGASKLGLSFEFHNLHFQPKKSPRPILHEVSGEINAGSLWGVMGASGAGKSTFVNVLMGKTSHTGGVTKVNGVAGDIKKYKKMIGYVPQDDIVLPELTVRENILHSARVRLPSSWKDSEIQHHVDILLRCLQLDHVKNSLVGSTAAPVISGGQRKRVSIGMELAAAPMAVFLDEPTSGLDATAAASIMSTLKALSRLGMTIVTIIHQPRQEIFESLDSLCLLGKGRMIYIGRETDMQPYFESLGFAFPEHTNPADVMGDIIAGEGKPYKPQGDISQQHLIDSWHNTHSPDTPMLDKRNTISMAETSALRATIKSRGAPWFRQIYFCLRRSLLQQYRLRSSFFFELGTGSLAGFLIGLAETSQKGTNFKGIYQNPYAPLSTAIDAASVPQMALLVGLAIGLTASAPGVKIFGEEKLVYWREAAAGHNRFAYYVGKVLSTLPRMILATFHFTVFFLLLSTPRISWMDSFVANLLYFWCIYGLASIVSMITRREDGPLLAVMSSLIVGVLNGMSPQLSKVRTWHMQWLWRASPGTWLAEAYFTQNVTPWAYLYQIDLIANKIGYHLGQFGRDCLMLLVLGAIYRVVAFGGLVGMNRAKQR